MPWNIIIMFALLIVSAVITALLAKKTTASVTPPATLSDFQIPQVDEGTPQAVVFGDVWLVGWQVLWYGNLRSEAIMSKSEGGGKK